MDTQARIGVVLAVMIALSIALYLAAGSSNESSSIEAYGACFKYSGMLICRVEIINNEEAMLTIRDIRLSAGNETATIHPLYNYTSIPGHTHADLSVAMNIGGGKSYVILAAPRYNVVSLASVSGGLTLSGFKPRSVFNETWVSPEGSLEGFYPIMLSHKRLITGPGSAAYVVLKASTASSNISMLHVKLYAFHDELVYEEVLEGGAQSYTVVLPLYYIGHEPISGATSILVAYKLSGGSKAMLVIETQAWRTMPIHMVLDLLPSGSIETYLPVLPGSQHHPAFTPQHS